MVTGLLAAVPQASASTGAVPGPQAACGVANINYAFSACVTIVNATRGFTGPGATARSAGIALTNAGRCTESNCTYRQPMSSDTNLGVNQWVASSCTTPLGWLNGCKVLAFPNLTTPDQVPSGNATLQGAIIDASGASQNVNLDAYTFRKDRATGTSCTTNNPFLHCTGGHNSGTRNNNRYDYEIRNDTLTVRIQNAVASGLTLQTENWGGLVRDRRGDTTTYPTGTIPAYSGSGAAPAMFFGAIRSKGTSSVALVYTVDAGIFRGNTISIELTINNEGHITTGSKCEVNDNGTQNAVQCRFGLRNYDPETRNTNAFLEISGR